MSMRWADNRVLLLLCCSCSLRNWGHVIDCEVLQLCIQLIVSAVVHNHEVLQGLGTGIDRASLAL